MGKRTYNPRLAKIHRNYSVEEIAELYGIHKNSVRMWIKQGLPTIDDKRPKLVHGQDLRAFLDNKRTKNKCSCKPGEIYCVRCREPRSPAGNMADYQPVTSELGNLVGICPSCEIMIYRRTSLAKLERIRGHLDIGMPEAL